MVIRKRFLCLVVGLVLVIGFLGSVSGITGSIGNARMILRTETGETLEKYILVKNVNDVSVDIELFASGDLEEDIVIKDGLFELGSGEEKRAYFDIKVRKEGSSESRINVKFTPIDGGNGVGLSSTVIVIAEKGPGFVEGLIDDGSEGIDFITGSVIGSGSSNSFIVIGLSLTGLIFFVFMMSLIVFLRKTKKGIEVVERDDRKSKPKKSSSKE